MARTSRKTIQERPTETRAATYRTAMYVRLSVENNGKDSDSIENQQKIIREYIAERPFLVLTDVFIDNGFTGTDFDRPGFTNMMQAVSEGRINCIIVKDLSRLGRSYIETGEFIEKICPFYGLRFISITEGFDTFSGGEGNAAMAALLTNIVNDYYAKDISRKVTTALRTKLERGDYIGNYAPYGYIKSPDNKSVLLPDPETAPVVRMIFDMRAEGMAVSAIQRQLNSMGIPSPSQHKRDQGIITNFNRGDKPILWNKHILSDMLRNIVYIGHLEQRRNTQCLYAGIPYHASSVEERVIVQNTHQPIVDVQTFGKVQEINRRATERAKAQNDRHSDLPKQPNLFGKKFRCADCGAVIKLCRSISRKGDKVYFTFKCPTHEEHGSVGCSKRRISLADMNEAVLATINSHIALFVDARKAAESLGVSQRSAGKQDGIQSVKNQLSSLRQELERKKSLSFGMYRDLRNGLLTQEDYAQNKEILTADIQALEQRIAELEANRVRSEKPEAPQWSELVERFCDADTLTAEMVSAFIECIYLRSDNSIEIHLNYMDEFEQYVDSRTLGEEEA